ncbi:hypothetical protein [Blastomonas fulva]
MEMVAIMEFQADSIQGVLFLMPNQQQGDALQLWGNLFPSDSPDEFQRATNSPALNSSAGGERGGVHVTLNAQVGRIDLIFSQPPASGSIDAGPPRISDIAGSVAKVVELLKKLGSESRVIRAAIVLDLAKTVAPGDEASEVLQNLPGFPFPANVSDVNLQFNSRKMFDFSQDFLMNRLCLIVSGQVGFVIGQTMPNPSTMKMVPYVGFKVDINSAPQMTLPQGSLDVVIDELALEALALANEGIGRLIK